VPRGATHIAVATDHVIESFRNGLWPGYKTGEGIDPDLWSQFELLEDVLSAAGVVVWPMVEFEADVALAVGAPTAARDARVERVIICTPDKDLAQCVRRRLHQPSESGWIWKRHRCHLRPGQVLGSAVASRLAGTQLMYRSGARLVNGTASVRCPESTLSSLLLCLSISARTHSPSSFRVCMPDARSDMGRRKPTSRCQSRTAVSHDRRRTTHVKR
jgi:hypothetical protein